MSRVCLGYMVDAGRDSAIILGKKKKGKKIKVHVNTFLHPKTKQAGCLDEMMRSSSYHHGPSLLRFWVG